jgi:hypothetical protein
MFGSGGSGPTQLSSTAAKNGAQKNGKRKKEARFIDNPFERGSL